MCCSLDRYETLILYGGRMLQLVALDSCVQFSLNHITYCSSLLPVKHLHLPFISADTVEAALLLHPALWSLSFSTWCNSKRRASSKQSWGCTTPSQQGVTLRIWRGEVLASPPFLCLFISHFTSAPSALLSWELRVCTVRAYIPTFPCASRLWGGWELDANSQVKQSISLKSLSLHSPGPNLATPQNWDKISKPKALMNYSHTAIQIPEKWMGK